MKYLLIFTIFLLQGNSMLAQPLKNSIAGEYDLSGVIETASGFKLAKDGKFQFFYSQGAVDQFGEGRWKLEGKNIVFNSISKPGNDFKLVISKQVDDSLVTIKINDANTMILQYVVCTIETSNGIQTMQMNTEGVARFQKGTVKKISLSHKLWNLRTSEFTIGSDDNYFEYSILSTIAQVYFNNFKLSLNGKELKGKHPLLEGTEYSYVKN